MNMKQQSKRFIGQKVQEKLLIQLKNLYLMLENLIGMMMI